LSGGQNKMNENQIRDMYKVFRGQEIDPDFRGARKGMYVGVKEADSIVVFIVDDVGMMPINEHGVQERVAVTYHTPYEIREGSIDFKTMQKTPVDRFGSVEQNVSVFGNSVFAYWKLVKDIAYVFDQNQMDRIHCAVKTVYEKRRQSVIDEVLEFMT